MSGLAAALPRISYQIETPAVVNVLPGPLGAAGRACATPQTASAAGANTTRNALDIVTSGSRSTNQRSGCASDIETLAVVIRHGQPEPRGGHEVRCYDAELRKRTPVPAGGDASLDPGPEGTPWRARRHPASAARSRSS